jgi:hypothetical protein
VRFSGAQLGAKPGRDVFQCSTECAGSGEIDKNSKPRASDAALYVTIFLKVLLKFSITGIGLRRGVGRGQCCSFLPACSLEQSRSQGEKRELNAQKRCGLRAVRY